jgi:CheY-like chemotaxis protein
VEIADNGNQSLERLKRGMNDFDLMITDLQMPVCDTARDCLPRRQLCPGPFDHPPLLSIAHQPIPPNHIPSY